MTKAKISPSARREAPRAAAFPFFVVFKQTLKLRAAADNLAIMELSKTGDK